MYKDFRYLVNQYTEPGARDIFEKLCAQMCYSIYDSQAKSVSPNPGDDGIDILIGDLPNPDQVYQCKFFYDRIGDSQKKQIRESFETVTSKYDIEKWVLCIATVMTVSELAWWSKWKNEKELETSICIELYDGANIISKLKKYDLYEKAFNEDMRLSLARIERQLNSEKDKIFNEVIYGYEDELDIINDYQEAIFVKMLRSAQIHDVDDCIVEFYNAEIAYKTLLSKDEIQGSKAYSSLKDKIWKIWKTQYRILKHPSDGNKLLGNVNRRIEDLDDTVLKFTPEFSILAKNGVLHQLADEKKVGWVENYLIKLSEYMMVTKKEEMKK